MNAALRISKTGLSAQDAEMSAIANNIANVNTTGFKRDRVMFQICSTRPVKRRARCSTRTTSCRPGCNSVAACALSAPKTFTEGNVETTDNAMNVAIMGQGFLQV